MENKPDNYTPIKKLDTTLKILNHNNTELDTIPMLIEKVPFKTLNKEVKLILDKLILDNHAAGVNITIGNETQTNYYITFNGRLFIQNGGYKRQKRKESIVIVLQFLATTAIAVGTLAAGYEPLKKLIQWVVNMFHC